MHSEFTYPDTVRSSNQMDATNSGANSKKTALKTTIDDFLQVQEQIGELSRVTRAFTGVYNLPTAPTI